MAGENLQLVSNSVAVGSKILCGRFRKKSNFIISIQKVLYHVFFSININVEPVVNALLKKPFPEKGKSNCKKIPCFSLFKFWSFIWKSFLWISAEEIYYNIKLNNQKITLNSHFKCKSFLQFYRRNKPKINKMFLLLFPKLIPA